MNNQINKNNFINILANKDLLELIFLNASTITEISNLKLVSKRWHEIICQTFTEPKISGLLTQPFESLQALQHQFRNLGYYRNSGAVIYNIFLALKRYSETSDVNGIIETISSQGHGSSAQPNIIKKTFQNALDKKLHGGVIQTLTAIEEDLKTHNSQSLPLPLTKFEQRQKEDDQEKKIILKTGKQILGFLKGIDLK